MEQESPDIEDPDEGERRLPPALAAGLAPRIRHALDHPVRRRILRTLNDSKVARSPDQIAIVTIPPPSLSALSYHVRVLAEMGCLRAVGTRRHDGRATLLYVSTVAEDREVLAVLQVTRQLDRGDA